MILAGLSLMGYASLSYFLRDYKILRVGKALPCIFHRPLGKGYKISQPGREWMEP